MEKLKELFTAFSGGLVAVVYLVYALAMYCIAGIAVSDITGWDWLGYIAAPIFIFLRMTFCSAGVFASRFNFIVVLLKMEDRPEVPRLSRAGFQALYSG